MLLVLQQLLLVEEVLHVLFFVHQQVDVFRLQAARPFEVKLLLTVLQRNRELQALHVVYVQQEVERVVLKVLENLTYKRVRQLLDNGLVNELNSVEG